MKPIVTNLTCEYRKNPIGIDVKRPRLGWIILTTKRNTIQSAYQIQVTTIETSTNILIWDTGKVASEQSNQIEYAGLALKSRTRYYYRVRVWDELGQISEWSKVYYWEMGLLNQKEWIAECITPLTASEEYVSNAIDPCPYLRKTFELCGLIKRARIYVTCLGLYELHLNGEKVSDDLFTPGWTSYHKRLQYQTYDVTNRLSNGMNTVGAVLGNGWYKGYLGWGEKNRELYGTRTALLLQIHITYANGNEQVIISDESWKASTGPILMSEIYHGETYDARKEMPGWDTPIFDDSSWVSVKRMEFNKSILIASNSVPVRRMETIHPLQIIKTPDGETVIDMGQNMVGWLRFTINGPENGLVVLKFGEVLDKYGNFYNKNLRAAKQTIKYTLKGKGNECFEPHFTYQGFRYIKLEKYPVKPNLEDFTGVVIYSDLQPTGEFTCSHDLINQLHQNIIWSQKGNFLDIPTDCPQRDERFGWTGDAQVYIRTASFNMNTAPFFTKWLKDLKADQLENGGMPLVIPSLEFLLNNNSAAGWGDAATICPWTLYLCYGDKRVLEEQYDSMKGWVDYIRSQTGDTYLWTTGFQLGDWLALNGETPKYYIATAYFAYSTSILIKAAEVLHKNADMLKYKKLYYHIVEAFRKEFTTPDGKIAVPTQTAQVLALNFNLIEEKNRKITADTLVNYIEKYDNHLTTGFLGTPYLCQVLTDNGYNDMANKLIMQTSYPSWIYEITKGATTIWEHWNSIKEDGSICCPDMNSFNHYAFGSVGDWLYRVVGGINIDEKKPGYKHIIINPKIGVGFNYAKAELESMYGKIKTEWEINDGTTIVNITIPPNTTATVDLPFSYRDKLTEKGKPIEGLEGLKRYTAINDIVRLEIGSGNYEFVCEHVNRLT